MPRVTTPADPWHYPRPELAAKYLQVFDVGLSSARALFAKRRMGKSEFLEQDLIPAARDAGYLTVYLNLWDARSQPAAAFLAALTRALKPTGLRMGLWRRTCRSNRYAACKTPTWCCEWITGTIECRTTL